MPTTDERGIVSKSKLTALATAIKTKASVSGTYTLDDLVDVVDDIETGGVTPTGTKQVSITQNGTTTEDVTNYASAEITVNVPSSGITPSGTIQITENGTVDVTQYASANVNVGGGISLETLNVLQNGTTNAPNGTAYNKVIVNVPTGGGAFDGYDVLGTFTLAEDASSWEIEFTSAMQNYDAYILSFTNFKANKSEYPYITINRRTGGYYPGNVNTTARSMQFVVLPRTDNVANGRLYIEGCTPKYENFTYPINYIYLRSYYNDGVFKAGSELTVYGAKLQG